MFLGEFCFICTGELCSSRTPDSFYLQGASHLLSRPLWGTGAGGDRGILLNVLRDAHCSLTGSTCLAPLADPGSLVALDREQTPTSYKQSVSSALAEQTPSRLLQSCLCLRRDRQLPQNEYQKYLKTARKVYFLMPFFLR